jgi:hypothetical protein
MERDKTSISAYYEKEQSLRKAYLKLRRKYMALRALLFNLNHKLLEYFDNEKDDERF